MAVGIIVEWNPFHNGHLYHINKVKEMFPGEKIIAVCSGEFVQRGELAVLSFEDRKKIAMGYGVDEVYEIPQEYVLQAAKYFAIGAIMELNKHNVDKIVFGSESDELNILFELSEIEAKSEFKKTLKSFMKQGNSYKVAYELTTLELSGKCLSLPNDILGFEYIKAIKFLGVDIKPYTIKRTNDYHCEELSGDIISATAIRKLLDDGVDINDYVPFNWKEYNFIKQKNMFKSLKEVFATESLETIKTFKLVDEGIENRFKKILEETDNLDDFINMANSKRYSSSRIKRTICNIILRNKKDRGLQ